jgi:sugar-specific transcriptional regulator TrmB
MDTAILEDIGLTGAEIKVFLTLLELGTSTAGEVVKKSGLQNAVVHRAFHSLSEKGIITYILEGRIKNYQAIEPKHLLEFIDEKKARIKKLLPELEAKRALAKKKPKAAIFQGVRGIKELLSLLIDTHSTEFLAYGGAQKSDEVMGTYFWDMFQKRKIKNKIKSRLLFHLSLKWWADKVNKNFPQVSVKYTDEGFEELTETFICGNRVGIIIWLDKPFGFLIDEELAARSYKKFFKLLWNRKE